MSVATRPMAREQARAIAAAFAPARLFGSRWDYFYSRSKLASDPLYPGVCEALRDSTAPLLDIGCGLGLLAHALRADGIGLHYRGIDNDAGKIERARAAARRQGLSDVGFERIDLAAPGFSLDALGHCGSVAILDVLQFIPPDAQDRTVDAAIGMLAPGARLVIRTGLAGHDARARITRAVDWLSRVLRWMNTGPKAYPERAALASLLADRGLRSTFTPRWGGTPFNNWLLVAEHSSGGSGTTQR